MESIIELLKKLGTAIGDNAISAYQDYCKRLDDINKINEAENRLASLAGGYEFVFIFRDLARTLAVGERTPYVETYLSFADEAMAMLAAGYEPADVLDYFEKLLEKARGKRI